MVFSCCITPAAPGRLCRQPARLQAGRRAPPSHCLAWACLPYLYLRHTTPVSFTAALGMKAIFGEVLKALIYAAAVVVAASMLRDGLGEVAHGGEHWATAADSLHAAVP